jgi:tetratricopeptide (TPR) repeat protein
VNGEAPMIFDSKAADLRGYHTALLVTIVVLLFNALLPISAPAQNPARGGQESIDALLSIAESQYEIVRLTIKQGMYDRVLPEMRKIYELNLPPQYEQAVAESASLVAHMLVENKQFGLAHDVLNEALPHMKDDRDKASLLKIQAYVYKSEGKLQEAMQTLEQAIAIERRLIHP